MEQRVDNYNATLNSRTRRIIQFRALGILPVVFFLLQGIHYWRIGELGHTLWMCNIGNLVLAIGLFINNATLIRISGMWMVPGLVVWFIYVVLAWGVLFSSTLAHVGGTVVGMIALRRVGMDRQAWLYGLLWYFVVQLFSRWLTPANLNVNVAHAIDERWRGSFNSYWKFWMVLTSLVAVCLWLLRLLLARIFPVGVQQTKPQS
jgi:hypothetical protein